MPEVNTEKIFASFLLSVEQVTSIDEFNDLEKEYLGKNSLISEERKKLSSMSEISRKKYGKVLQELSTQISERLNQERLSFQSKFFKEKELNDNKDITINWYKDLGSRVHILTSVMNEVVDIFSAVGYTVATGPEAETSWHNFDALNTPDWHPARYESDTLYLDENLEQLL